MTPPEVTSTQSAAWRKLWKLIANRVSETPPIQWQQETTEVNNDVESTNSRNAD